MRLLQVAHQYPPEFIGGVELHTQALARELVRRGHEVSVFFRSHRAAPGVESWLEGDVRVWAASTGPLGAGRRFLATFSDEALLASFKQVLTESRPDLVHIHHLMGLPASLAEWLVAQGIPYVITLHDYWWLCANAQLLTNDSDELCEGPKLWVNCGRCAIARAGHKTLSPWLAPGMAPLFAYRHRRLESILTHAARVISPTHFTKQLHEQMRLPPSGITVIPHGIALPEPLPAPAPREPGLYNIAYVGGIAHQKGLHVLLAALEQLPRESVTLSIYGNPTVFPEYVATLHALSTHPGVRWRGSIPNAVLFADLAAADVLVVPSIWYESAGLVIQEAFAVGVPVIVSQLGALAERVEHEINGLHVPPDEPTVLAAALQRLLDEPSLLPKLRAGIQPVRTIQAQVADIEVLYQAALDSVK
ncbi:MAG: glycosyltransferase family 4 protein [Ardenticatenales bacterium]|nr:glycosyltransferase family 4 protein [Ardenticatenales bacterium]